MASPHSGGMPAGPLATLAQGTGMMSGAQSGALVSNDSGATNQSAAAMDTAEASIHVMDHYMSMFVEEEVLTHMPLIAARGNRQDPIAAKYPTKWEDPSSHVVQEICRVRHALVSFTNPPHKSHSHPLSRVPRTPKTRVSIEERVRPVSQKRLRVAKIRRFLS